MSKELTLSRIISMHTDVEEKNHYNINMQDQGKYTPKEQNAHHNSVKFDENATLNKALQIFENDKS